MLIGNGASQLEDLLADGAGSRSTATARTGPRSRKRAASTASDHISLAKVGVPMLDPEGGFDLVTGGKVAGRAVRDAYTANHYHQPSDEYDPKWDLSGPVEDLKLLYALGQTLANSTQWPDWYAGNEFRSIRDKSRGG